jgi:hypothetical protein
MKQSSIVPAAVLSSFFATACTEPPEPPTVVQQSPNMVELRWFNDSGDLDQATLVARRRCAEYGRQPDLDSISMDEDVSLATFRCR